METHTPVRRMVSNDSKLGKHRELAQALDGLNSAMMAHAAYFHDPVEVIQALDELRDELTGPKPDRARVRALMDEVSAGIRRPTADSRMLQFIDQAAARVNSALGSV